MKSFLGYVTNRPNGGLVSYNVFHQVILYVVTTEMKQVNIYCQII